MLGAAAAPRHAAFARLVVGAGSSLSRNERLSLIVAAGLILAAGAWLAVEVRRAWSHQRPRSPENAGYAQAPVDDGTSPQLLAEIAQLRTQVSLLRDATESRETVVEKPAAPEVAPAASNGSRVQPEPPARPPSDAELAKWALAGLEARAAERQRVDSGSS